MVIDADGLVELVVKAAVTLWLTFITTVQVGRLPLHAPDHPVNVLPTPAEALSTTFVPKGNGDDIALPDALVHDPAGTELTFPDQFCPEPTKFMVSMGLVEAA